MWRNRPLCLYGEERQLTNEVVASIVCSHRSSGIPSVDFGVCRGTFPNVLLKTLL
jgi:hypothetical protein